MTVNLRNARQDASGPGAPPVGPAFRERSLGLVYLGVFPDFAPARADRRVQAILDAMSLRPVERQQS